MPTPDTTPHFRWTKDKATAAALLAEDELNDLEIAARVGVTARTLRNWKAHPAFAARVAQHVKEFGEAAQRFAIARRMRRLAALDRRWLALQQIVDERAADPAMDGVPGGTTGLLIRRVRVIGTGKVAQRVEEYVVDTALLRELLASERQAARECSQWEGEVAPTSLDGEEGAPCGFTAEEVEQLLERLTVRLGLAPVGQDDQASQGPGDDLMSDGKAMRPDDPLPHSPSPSQQLLD